MKKSEEVWHAAHILFKLVPIKKGVASSRILVIEDVFLVNLGLDERGGSVNKKLAALAQKHQRSSKVVVVNGVEYRRELIRPIAVYNILSRKGEEFTISNLPSSGTEISYFVFTVHKSDDVKKLVSGQRVRVASACSGWSTPQSRNPPFTEVAKQKFLEYLKRRDLK